MGISSLAEFSAVIADLETMEPVSCVVHASKRGIPGEVPDALRKSNILKLLPRLDALLDLLVATADSLAASKDLMDDGANPGLTPTIQ
jgi:hypothetical protein